MMISHDGSLGDLVYHSHFAVELSEALSDPIEDFILQTDVKMAWKVPNHPYVDVNLTRGAAEFLKPFLETCKSFKRVSISDSIPDGCVNISRFRTLPLNFFSGDIREWPYELAALHLPKDFSRVLFNVSADGAFNGRIGLVYTERYNNVKLDLSCLAPFKEKFVFFGLPREHSLFEKQFFKVEYAPVKDALEFAQLAKGCRVVVGNQSGLFSILEEVKANRILLPAQFQNYQRNGYNYAVPGPCNVICCGGWWENCSTSDKLVKVLKGVLDGKDI